MPEDNTQVEKETSEIPVVKSSEEFLKGSSVHRSAGNSDTGESPISFDDEISFNLTNDRISAAEQSIVEKLLSSNAIKPDLADDKEEISEPFDEDDINLEFEYDSDISAFAIDASTDTHKIDDQPEKILAWVEVISRPDVHSGNNDEPCGKIHMVIPDDDKSEEIIQLKYYRRLDTSNLKYGMHIPTYVEARQADDPRKMRYDMRTVVVLTFDPDDEAIVAIGDPNTDESWVFGAVFHGCRIADVEGFADGDAIEESNEVIPQLNEQD